MPLAPPKKLTEGELLKVEFCILVSFSGYKISIFSLYSTQVAAYFIKKRATPKRTTRFFLPMVALFVVKHAKKRYLRRMKVKKKI